LFNLTKIRNLQENEIERRVVTLRKIYVTLAVLGIIVLLIKWREFFSEDITKIGQIFFHFIVYASIYFGLKNKRNWIIMFILFVSALGFLLGCLYVFSPANTLAELAEKISGIFFLLFYGYQLIFFSGQNVRTYYGVKGRIIF